MWRVQLTRTRRRAIVALMVAGFLVVAVVDTAAIDASAPPDDGLIAYTSDAEGRPSIWTVDTEGTNATNLTTQSGNDAFVPVWSPDGYRIAFATNGEIWVMEPDGSDLTNLTNTPDVDEFDMEWSPDGSKIAYWDNGELQTINNDGTNAVTLANGSGNWRPRWSPDGSQILYTSQTSNTTFDILVVGANGTHQSRLTDGDGAITNNEPEWSPDGSLIAFHSDRSGTSGIWVMEADGSNPVNLFLGQKRGETMTPAWSPDGSGIAFTAGRDVWVMNADGSNARNLTNTAELFERRPVWSPDGTRLAFDSSPGTWDIWVIGADGSGLLNLSDTPDDQEWLPVWQPQFPPVGLVDPASGIWRLRDWSGRSVSFYYGDPGDFPFVGDWDCDGVDTPGLYRQSDGYVYLRDANTQGTADIRFYFGDPGDVPLAGDWNGDGCDSVSLYRPSEQVFYVVNDLGSNDGGLGAADYWFQFGNPGDTPVTGDWDGEGIDEVGLHRGSTGLFYWRNTLDTGVADGSIFFGNSGDRFIAGNWGPVDGIDTPAVFRPSDSTFYLRHTLTEGIADQHFVWVDARTNWLPIAGNFGLK